MICPNCNRELPDDTKFCGGCGTRMLPPEQISVQFTETVFEQPVQFTEPVFEEPANEPVPVIPEIPEVIQENQPKPKFADKVKAAFGKIPAKYLKLGGIVAAVVVVAIVALCIFAGGTGSASGNGSGYPAGALYLKDGELYYSDYSKKGPQEITSKLWDNASSSRLREYASAISNTIHVTEDGKTMFYMDKLSSSEGTLYWRSLTNFKEDAEKISSGVSRYTVSRDGKTVTYLKGETLCQYNMKDEEKLEKNVSSYRVSQDGKIIYFLDTDGTWYVLKNGEKEKIGSDITIEYITEDYSTVYYMNDDKVYRKTIGKDKEKIVSKVEEITAISEDGTFYYMTAEEVELADFFVKDTEEYAGLDEELSNSTMEFYTIGYYDGKKSVELFETCSDADVENGVMLCYQYDLSQVPTIPYTELIAFYSDSSHYYLVDAAQAMVQQGLDKTGALYIAINGKTSLLELEEIDDLVISDDGSVIYALCEMDYEKDQGVLYKITVSGDKIKTTEVLDEDVSAQRGGYFVPGDSGSKSYFVYFKDLKEDVGDLYVDGTLVDSDVYARKYIYATGNGSLLYFVDFDAEKNEGILKSWNGKEAVEILDGAYAFSTMKNGSVLVASDYSDKDDTFTLFIWNGKEITEISEDVYDAISLENGDVLVGTDYSDKHSSYTLNLWNGRALSVISEDVYDYTVLPNNEILYLYDYSTSKCEGELYHWNGRKTVMVDEDVAAVIDLPGTVSHSFHK
jgi:hypothetical protein